MQRKLVVQDGRSGNLSTYPSSQVQEFANDADAMLAVFNGTAHPLRNFTVSQIGDLVQSKHGKRISTKDTWPTAQNMRPCKMWRPFIARWTIGKLVMNVSRGSSSWGEEQGRDKVVKSKLNKERTQGGGGRMDSPIRKSGIVACRHRPPVRGTADEGEASLDGKPYTWALSKLDKK